MAKIQAFNKEIFGSAKEILKQGGVIAFPTETVYGIGCDYRSKEAVEKIYKLKGRDFNKPLQILIANLSQLEALIDNPGEQITSCDLVKHWPGPLTLIFWKNKTEKIGVRMPNHSILLELLKETGPIAATSANLSGRPDAVTVQEVAEIFPDLDLILDGGKAEIGKSSTVVDVTEKPYKILRLGALKIKEQN